MLQRWTAPLLEIESRLDESTARGLASAVSRAVRDGAIARGTRLPPIRTVARALHLSPTTVSAAWGCWRAPARSAPTAGAARLSPTGRGRAARAISARWTARRRSGWTCPPACPIRSLLPDLSQAISALTSVSAPSSYLDDPVLPAAA